MQGEKVVTGKDIGNEFVNAVQEGNEHIIEIAREELGKGKGNKLVFAMQKRVLQPEQPQQPVKMESPRRAHIFHDAEGFAAYLAKYKTDNTVVLVNVREQGETVLSSVSQGFLTTPPGL